MMDLAVAQLGTTHPGLQCGVSHLMDAPTVARAVSKLASDLSAACSSSAKIELATTRGARCTSVCRKAANRLANCRKSRTTSVVDVDH